MLLLLSSAKKRSVFDLVANVSWQRNIAHMSQGWLKNRWVAPKALKCLKMFICFKDRFELFSRGLQGVGDLLTSIKHWVFRSVSSYLKNSKGALLNLLINLRSSCFWLPLLNQNCEMMWIGFSSTTYCFRCTYLYSKAPSLLSLTF